MSDDKDTPNALLVGLAMCISTLWGFLVLVGMGWAGLWLLGAACGR